MWMSNEIHSSRRGYRVPVNVVLRECSVVIIGSSCRICGNHFKCESDVALHTQWRHNGVIESLINKIGYEIYPEKIGQKCDICDTYLDPISDLKIHKRLIHKDRQSDRKISRKKTVRVKFKLKGVTTLDINLDRKYLKILSPDVRYYIDADIKSDTKLLKTDTKLFKNEEDQNNCLANIDLSLPAHFVANNKHIQYRSQVHEATNQYFADNFTFTKHNTVACPTDMVGRNSTEISNMLHRDEIIGSDSSCKEHENGRDFTSQDKITNTFITSYFIDNIIDNYKKSLRRINKQERRKKRKKKKKENVHSQNENSMEDPKIFSTCQQDKSDKITTPMFKQNCCFNESCYDSIRSLNEAKGNKRTRLISSLAKSMEIRHNVNSNNLDGDMMKCSPVHLTRLYENKSMKVTANVDDDVQEVLRITRGNVQSDINHESPNRTEREILMQNITNEIYKLPLQRKPANIQPKRYSSECTTNLGAFDYSSYIPITEKGSEFLSNAFDKKLGICLENLDRCGIKYYNDIQEINNNNLEDYEMYAHQSISETWVQTAGPQYTNKLKVNDNDAIVTLD